jgi:hypothetical protein
MRAWAWVLLPGMSGPECQVLDNVHGGDPQKAGWCYGFQDHGATV